MAYIVALDRMYFPIPPKKMTTQINNKNKTIDLLNGGEWNHLTAPGLTEIEFTLLLPQQFYPFAYYPRGKKRALYYLRKLEKLKAQNKVFRFVMTRSLPDGTLLFDTNLLVTLEEYNIVDDVGEGFDITVDIKLKQHNKVGTIQYKAPTDKKTPKKKVERPAPEKKGKTYTVKRGDSLWMVAKTQWGDGGKYPQLYAMNKDLMDRYNAKYKTSKYTIYPNQVLKLA